MSAVNHPSHYNLPGKKECIEQMKEDYGETITAIFCLTNAYKYLYRAGEKEGNSASQDIEKARWYYRYLSEITDMVSYDSKLEKLEDDVYRRLKRYA